MASSARLAILGIDPGTRWAGLAVVRGDGQLVDRARLPLLDMALDGQDPNSRVLALHLAVVAWLARYQPAIVAVENPAHHRNAHTAQLLGRAVGACVLAALMEGLVVLEYRPGQVRRASREACRRWGCHGWSEDEVAAAGAAWCALSDYLESVGAGGPEPPSAPRHGGHLHRGAGRARGRAKGCSR